jgi:Asp-tRNA(Asn)/Glu-tRNA(Gln) amidotransferase A subunit family amidase
LSSIAKLATALRTGAVDMIEYIDQLCDHIEAHDPSIEALLPEPARRARLRAEALALQTRFPDPGSRPALFGVPVGVKDIFHVDGFETRAGSALPARLFAGPEAVAVSRLKAHGALILGKTVATEFAFSEPGPTRNPHRHTHTPGGSSSGSAAAVAAGFAPLALGTQTIGSVSRPASFCGVTGFKPSYGRIPVTGCVPFSMSVDHVGFFAPDLESVHLIASLLCDDWQPERQRAPLPDRLTVGVVTGAYLDEADTEMRGAVEREKARLVAAGYRICEVDLFPDWARLVETHYELIAAEKADVHRSWFMAHRHLYRPGTLALIERGWSADPARVHSAQAGRLTERARIEQIMHEQGIHCWLTPAATGSAPEGLAHTGSPLMNLPWSYTGLPSLSIPGGTCATGLPLGLQWVGGFGMDEQLLALIERLTAN